ncbi:MULTISPECIES: phosphoadenylyl-sulfate reductase [unclassified Roseitalea]|uniref:phosphoadenylyl-sulfate reductase n=1 Tax=unclassified Roseitalea TaxID=2639107 RepID=UPI00273E5D37|nr:MULTISPECIES: phosphoadenylyl-sulfate reductase [unclassified Roseitalea]
MPALRDRQAETLDFLRVALAERRFGDIAAVSSFGAESAVLLHLIARVDPATPVIFIDTRMLFAETLAYKATLVRHLELSDVRTVAPDGSAIRDRDPWGRLHLTDPDACCAFRKSRVLDAALEGLDGWITGRKRYQAATRADIELIERMTGGKTKLNPLAFWHADEVAEYAEAFDLPQHPLTGHGYASIGCASCTSPVGVGEDARAGRWRGMDKIECGIHIDNGAIVRQAGRNG